MRLHRFYVLQPLGEEVVINDVSLISQWTKVFRYTAGDLVVLFNGDGFDYHYSLSNVSKKECRLVRTEQTPSYIPKRPTTLCLSVIKKDNFELVCQKATELGVTRIIPMLSERSEKKNLSFDRLSKIVIESAEQCHRGDIPVISEIQEISHVLQALPEDANNIVLQMGGSSLFLASQKIHPDKEIFIFVGPEGGWGEHDLELFKAHTLPIYSTGGTVLRAETAAIAACALLTAS